MHYRIDFMLFWHYLDKKKFAYPDYKLEIYPYKWYDLRWIYQKPSFWLLLKIFRKNPNKITNQIHRNTSTIVLISEIFFTIKSIIEVIKLISI